MNHLYLKTRKKWAWLCLFAITLQIFMPISSLALTGGPSQPEVQSFEPIGTSEMVDVSSGSFVYNIPLLDVGGYPINLSYHSGVTMDQEASTVGLGWNINVGSINRTMRGLPDDFRGDQIKKVFNMKPNKTYGGKLGGMFEIFGVDPPGPEEAAEILNLQASLGAFYNNYTGVGLEFGITPGFTAARKGNASLTLGLGLSANSQSGIGLAPNLKLNYNKKVKENDEGDIGFLNAGLNIGTGINSRQGLQALSLSGSLGISGLSPEGRTVNDIDIKKSSRSLGQAGTSFDFAMPTYAPGGALSFLNLSGTYSFSAGGELFGFHGGLSITGYFSTQSLLSKSVTAPAYGFLFAQDALTDDRSLMDFNREKDGVFTENTPNLPLPVFTNDIYSVAGQGVGGSYQLKRHDIGSLRDPKVSSYGYGGNLGVEIGAAPVGYHAGGDFVVNTTKSYSSAWTEGNAAASTLNFDDANAPLGETAYFKIAGEKSVDDADMVNKNGGTDAVRVKLNPGGGSTLEVETDGENWIAADNTEEAITTQRPVREKRNQPITYLSAGQADIFGLERKIKNYGLNDFLNPQIEEISRVDEKRKEHHISEITVLRQDGLSYVYGIPAYNNAQSEVSFSVDPSQYPPDCATGLIAYTAGTDDSENNSRGIDNYYSKTEIPPYAHSYLLTAVYSTDYVDRTGNGPTPDDYGSYTKFNYSRLHEDYRWRTPYPNGFANYNEGFKTIKGDDKANYIAGKKEIWYLHSVESKTQIAEFRYDSRPDSQGAELNGNRQNLKKLVSITLYSLPDRRQHGQDAEPLKTVHFGYDNNLLGPGILNSQNGAGKLALTKLWFTYGKSQKGKLSPYQFFYEGHNPGYNLKAYNRWGSYQPNPATGCDLDNNQPPSTSDFPYVPQDDRAMQDLYASAHNLTDIQLPSGGKIEVKYEAHDYAYVQDKRAMEMVEIAGFGIHEQLVSTGNQLFQGSDGTIPNNVLYFKLRSPLSGNLTPFLAGEEVKRRYIRGAQFRDDIDRGYLYFKALVNLGKAGEGKYEYVPGYAKIETTGAIKSTGTDYDYGYIKLETVPTDDNGTANANPIAKAAWQFTRLNLPRIAYGEPDVDESSPARQILEALGGVAQQFGQFFGGFNEKMREKDFGKEVILNKSFMRLYSPEKMKIGGGSRVKQILLSDEWATLAGSYIGNDGEEEPYDNFEYGQAYDYTLEETVNGKVHTYSSGVAAYEPIIGGDENPFRQPVFFNEEMLLAPDNNHYQVAPFGESFFPAPQIIYSRVRVRSINPEESEYDIRRSKTGFTEYRYYTAKDFPLKTATTGVKAEPKRTNPIFKLLKINHKDYMTAAQGYVIELNDMHGKPKAKYVYDESGTRISGLSYRYKSDAYGLVNEATVINKDGTVTPNQTIGLESSLVTDNREGFSSAKSVGLHMNSDGFLAGIFPVITVVPLPSFQSEETRFRSMVTTKVVRRYGLLEKTVAFDLGSSVSTENLAWDAETGEVLLTRTENEFEDPVYNLNFPAHWAYAGMQAAWQNIGASFLGVSFANGVASPDPGIPGLFTPGDELFLEPTEPENPATKAWVKDVQGTSIYAIDINGSPIVGEFGRIRIIRSGHRNQQTAAIGSVTSLKNPIAGNNFSLSGKEVLNAMALEYSDQWQMWCGWEKDTCYYDMLMAGPVIETVLNLMIENQDLGAGTISENLAASDYFNFEDLLDVNQSGAYNCSENGFTLQSSDPNYTSFVYTMACDDNLFSNECFIALSSTNLGEENFTNIENFEFTASDQVEFTDSPGGGDGFNGTITGNWNNGISSQIEFKISCLPFGHDQLYVCDKINCPPLDGDIVNPYLHNLRSVHRPKKTWTYLTDRHQGVDLLASATTNTNIRRDGFFEAFSSFWTPGAPWTPNSNGWTWTTEATKYNPTGNQLESRDVLGRYSAELLGYYNTLTTAVAGNARYTQIAFEGFEDYDFTTYYSSYSDDCRPPRHFGFEVNNPADIGHTGKHSINIVPDYPPLEIEYAVAKPACDPPPTQPPFVPYTLDECDCTGIFSPNPGRYVFSAWVKEEQPATALSYDEAFVRIETGDQVYDFSASGDIIEGWQRIYGEFEIPDEAENIKIGLHTGSINAWFDDLRIHPFAASFKSFVYDDVNLRFTYELDENNYFTKYEYDLAGMLERVKKETERGVMTIQESRSGQHKN